MQNIHAEQAQKNSPCDIFIGFPENGAFVGEARPMEGISARLAAVYVEHGSPAAGVGSNDRGNSDTPGRRPIGIDPDAFEGFFIV